MSNNPFTGRIEELRRSGEEAVSPPPRRKRESTKDSEDRLIGCPMWWLQHILPAVNTKNQLVVAVYLWRRRVICGNRNRFDVPNGELKALKISHKIKLRTLRLLAAANVIEVNQCSAKASPVVTVLVKKPRGK